MRTMNRDIQALFTGGALGGLSDGRLLDRFIAARDHAAFQALVERHGPMVWGVCRRTLVDHHDAEDAFQATFLVLARRAASVAPREALAGWLYGVARRTAAKTRALATRRRARELPLSSDPENTTAAHDPLRELVPLLDHELSRLPEHYRTAIVLCELAGLTRSQAAGQLGWPEGTVASRLARGRTLLADRLKRRGAALPAAGGLVLLGAPSTAAEELPRALIGATADAARELVLKQAAVSMMPRRLLRLTRGVVTDLAIKKALVAATAGVLAITALGLTLMAGSPERPPAVSPDQAAPPAGSPPEHAAPPEQVRDETRTVLDRAAAAVPAVKDLEQRVWLLCEVARLQGRAGLREPIDATLKAVLQAAHDTESEHRLVDAAEALARAGDVSAAVKLVEPLSPNRDYGLAHVAAAQAAAGDAAGALGTAARVRQEPYKSEALRRVAEAQADAGDTKQALATAGTIADAAGRAGVLTALADRLQRAHDPAAPETLQRAREAADKAPTNVSNRAELAGVLARAGAVDDARGLAQGIKDPLWRDIALGNIATVEAERGDIALALRMAESIHEPRERAEAIKDVVTAQLRAHDLAAARTLAVKIEPGTARVDALLAIAKHEYRSGLHQQSTKTIATVLREAATLRDDRRAGNVKPAALARVARTQGELGEEKAALAWIEKQPEAIVRAWSLVGLANGLAERLPAPPPPGAKAKGGQAGTAPDEPTALATPTPAQEIVSRPVASFRGKLTLFGTQRPSDLKISRIEVMNPDGTELQPVLALDKGQFVVAGRVAPDGKRVAFSVSRDKSERAELWLLATDGGRRKIAENLFVAAWSPDGTRLAGYRRAPGAARTWENVIVDVATRRERRLPIAEADVVDDWSPDGEALAMMAGNVRETFQHPTKGTYPLRQVYLMRPDGTRPEPLTHRAQADSLDARFAPDGRRLAYFQRRHPEGRVLHYAVMQARDGSDARDVSQFDEVYAGNQQFKPNGPPCWSPDGSLVVWFVPRKKLATASMRPELLFLATDTGRPTRLDLHERGLVWVQAIDWR